MRMGEEGPTPTPGKLRRKQWHFNWKFTTYKEFIYVIQTFSQIFFHRFHTAIY